MYCQVKCEDDFYISLEWYKRELSWPIQSYCASKGIGEHAATNTPARYLQKCQNLYHRAKCMS